MYFNFYFRNTLDCIKNIQIITIIFLKILNTMLKKVILELMKKLTLI